MHTGGGHTSSIRILESHFGADTPIRDITTQAVDEFIRAETKRNISGSTINRRLAVLSRALHWALEADIIHKLPKLHRPKESEARMRVFAKDEIVAIVREFSQLGEERMGRYVKVLYGTGGRPGEVLALRVQDVDIQQQIVYLTGTKTGGSVRPIPMTPKTQTTLEEQIAEVGSGKLFRFTYARFSYYWKRVQTLLGQEADDGWVPYTLRHTYGSELANQGLHVQTIAHLMGHDRLEQTMSYIKLSGPHLRQGMSLLPDLDD
jgi:integrase